jgi:hypothetical protein
MSNGRGVILLFASMLGGLFGVTWLVTKDVIPHKDCPDCGKRAASITQRYCDCGSRFDFEDWSDEEEDGKK